MFAASYFILTSFMIFLGSWGEFARDLSVGLGC